MTCLQVTRPSANVRKSDRNVNRNHRRRIRRGDKLLQPRDHSPAEVVAGEIGRYRDPAGPASINSADLIHVNSDDSARWGLVLERK
jgi:hypothetical protein